jgi:hypothetical protein
MLLKRTCPERGYFAYKILYIHKLYYIVILKIALEILDVTHSAAINRRLRATFSIVKSIFLLEMYDSSGKGAGTK